MRLPLLLAMLCAPVVLASGKRPQTFEEPSPSSDEAIRRAKLKGQSPLDDFGHSLEDRPRPFPWGIAALSGMAALVVLPFAVRAYRRTTDVSRRARGFTHD